MNAKNYGPVAQPSQALLPIFLGWSSSLKPSKKLPHLPHQLGEIWGEKGGYFNKNSLQICQKNPQPASTPSVYSLRGRFQPPQSTPQKALSASTRLRIKSYSMDTGGKLPPGRQMWTIYSVTCSSLLEGFPEPGWFKVTHFIPDHCRSLTTLERVT